MKKYLLSLFAAFAFALGYAQLPTNSVCPDFTGTDLNGNVWNLYDLLDSGKPVVIEVSAAWCPPCWSYHNSGAMENFYNQYGPDGTDEAMVLFIEGESSNTTAQLYGTTTNQSYSGFTQGDWVTGTPFPIIDNASIASLLQITAFPTIYIVCPDRIINEVGQLSATQLHNYTSNANCTGATVEVDPRFLSVSGTSATCTNSSAGISILMQNKGTEPLTAATISVTGGIQPIEHEWTGNLASYATTTVNIDGVETNGTTSVTVSVTSEDGNPANSTNQLNITSQLPETTTHIRVVFTNDPWPGESSWKIRNSSGTVVPNTSSPQFPSTQSSPQERVFDYFLPNTNCYVFEFRDGYGDGLHGSVYGYWDGSIYVYNILEDGTIGEVIYGNDGSDFMTPSPSNSAVIDRGYFDATLYVLGVDEENSEALTLGVYPNPTSGQLNLSYTVTESSEVWLDVVNSLGSKVMSENLGKQHPGTYTSEIDLSSLPAGVYMINLNANGAASTVRVVVQ